MNHRERYELMLRSRFGKVMCLACGKPLGDDLRHLVPPDREDAREHRQPLSGG